MSQASNNLAAYSWSIADLLRGDFKQSQYGRIILPFTLLRRLECVLAPTKPAVLAEIEKLAARNLPEEAQEKLLLRATGGLSFFNTSRMDLSTLGESGIKANLDSYVAAFSKDAREIFEYFNFSEFVGQLNDANLLYKVVQRVRLSDLSPAAVSNHEMGLVFEELIRRFAESSNETAGEHFTPRDIVRLTTSLVFMEDDDALTKPGIIRTIYDPTAGTGGFLSSGMEYVHELNPQAVMRAYGQELNPESYAICKADMLIKGQDVSQIKLGNTLSADQLYADKFDYMLSNPPFGVDWKKIEGAIQQEHALKGFDGRFGPGLPRVSDGSLLFLLHLLNKLRPVNPGGLPSEASAKGGGRIGIILNGSPLFTGGAGSGESEIRRHILESDLLEAIVALPTDMFYNTGIATYVWILSNKKAADRKGRVMLINGVHLHGKMRKSLGSKRHEMDDEHIKTITRAFGDFAPIDPQCITDIPVCASAGTPQTRMSVPLPTKSSRGRPSANPKTEPAKTFSAKLFPTHAFGYRRITIERPLRESYQFSDERLATLRFAPKPLGAPMEWIFGEYGTAWTEGPAAPGKVAYGELTAHEAEIRAALKADFPELKEKHIKDLLDTRTWRAQLAILQKARQLQAEIGSAQHDDMNGYDAALKATGIKLDATEKKQITAAVSWKNPAAAKVIKKVHKGTKPAPLHGLFSAWDRHSCLSSENPTGKNAGATSKALSSVIEYQPDSDLRDYENVALDPSQTVDALNEAYFRKEVLPHVPDAWIDATKRDAKDEQVGIVGYEIPFNRHFYEYQPPRDLAEIDADLDAVSAEIMKLLQEVHS